MNQFFGGLFVHSTVQACLVDLTPPTFAGVSLLTPKNNGAIKVDWLAASDATPPIEYLIYIALGSVSAGTLFQPANLVTIAPAGVLTKHVFTLGDQTTFIVKDQVYTLGVRAKDGVGNFEFNTVILTTTALGSVDLAAIFQTLQTQFAAHHVNFVADHAAFVADTAAFDADHVDFVADHANFVADNAAFVTNINALSDLIATVRNPDLVAVLADNDRIDAVLKDCD